MVAAQQLKYSVEFDKFFHDATMLAIMEECHTPISNLLVECRFSEVLLSTILCYVSNCYVILILSLRYFCPS